MASDKKRRKADKAAKKTTGPHANGPVRHPDGDRRRRGVKMTIEQALEAKRLSRTIGLPPPDSQA